MNTYETIRGILINRIKIPAEVITEKATLNQIELDSLSAVELSMELEQIYGETFRDEEILASESIAGLITLVEERTGAAR